MDERMIPYFSHEGDMARMERANKRLWIVILVLIVALIGSNAGWLYYQSQFTDEITIDAKQDGSGVNIVGGEDVTYGADSKDN